MPDSQEMMKVPSSQSIEIPPDPRTPSFSTLEATRVRAVSIRPTVGPRSITPPAMRAVIGESESLGEVCDIVSRIAATHCTVLVTGESGTGKEVVAGSLHMQSRARGEFVAVNCGAIPENLLESEMFGHVKGAFTGATSNKMGYVELAEGGTLFLDEVGELPLTLQVKLLRLLQSWEYTPVGSAKARHANVRVVAATNVDLEEAIAKRTFREDLYYRLNVIHIRVPPLRERGRDIVTLANHFLRRACVATGRTVHAISPEAMQALAEYDWPGNVRELENTIERAVLLTRGNVVGLEDLSVRIRSPRNGAQPVSGRVELPMRGLDLREAVARYEDTLIAQALERTEWNKNKAAQLLGLNRTTLVEMIKRKQLEPTG